MRKTNCGGKLTYDDAFIFFAPKKFALFCLFLNFIIFYTAQGKQKKCGGLINFKACGVYGRKGLLQAVFSEDIRVLSKKP